MLGHSRFCSEMNAPSCTVTSKQCRKTQTSTELYFIEPKNCTSVTRAVDIAADIFPVTSKSGDVSASLLQISVPDWPSEDVMFFTRQDRSSLALQPICLSIYRSVQFSTCVTNLLSSINHYEWNFEPENKQKEKAQKKEEQESRTEKLGCSSI